MAQQLFYPINKSKLTASWKTNSYYNKFGFAHYGIDIISITSDRSVYGMGNGEVVKAGTDSVVGNFMILRYKDVYNHVTNETRDLVVRIWHLASIALKAGAKFTATTKIATYGNTGKYTTGAHLHLEVDKDTQDKYVNWSPSFGGNTANFIGSKGGATDKTMTNPFEWLSLKTTAPQLQTFTTVNDIYIRNEDKSPYIYQSDDRPKIEGIDVSSHNGVIDFNKIKASGKEFVFIRLGHAGWNGQIYANNLHDKKFVTNIKAATAAGLKVGVYLYSYCKDVKAAEVAAKETISLLENYDITYPVAFDIEDTSDTGVRYDKMDKNLNTAICKAFMSKIQEAGYYPILYTYKSFAENYLVMKDLAQFDFWLAQYSGHPTYQGNYSIWQYKGDVAGYVGSCPGVNGACDQNVSYKDYAKIITDMKKNQSSTKPIENNKSYEERISALEAKVKELESIIVNLI